MNKWLSTIKVTRRAVLTGFVASAVPALTGCTSDGHFNFLGYTTKPNIYDNVKTVYIPIFNNKTLQTAPFRLQEEDLTRAVIREVEMKGYKVISDPNRADTELRGTIVSLTKNLINRTQQNEVREGQLIVGVELVWRDLRSGVVLTNPPKTQGILPAQDLPQFDPDNPPRPEALEKARPVIVTAVARYLPEVGESTATAQTSVCNQLAAKIANMMEKDWKLPPKNCPPTELITPERQ